MRGDKPCRPNSCFAFQTFGSRQFDPRILKCHRKVAFVRPVLKAIAVFHGEAVFGAVLLSRPFHATTEGASGVEPPSFSLSLFFITSKLYAGSKENGGLERRFVGLIIDGL
jgi:hypothetical protein